MTPLELADRAKQLLSDPVMVLVFDAVRNRFVAELETVPGTDLAAQNHWTIRLQILKELREHLHTYTLPQIAEQQRKEHENWLAKARQKIPSTWRSMARQTVDT